MAVVKAHNECNSESCKPIALVEGLLVAIMAARDTDELDILRRTTTDLRVLLERINPDLELEILHIIGFREEKVGAVKFTTPASAIDGQIELGLSYIHDMLASAA